MKFSENLFNLSNRSYKIICSILLLILGISILGLPYYRIGFLNDDFGCIFSYRLQSWKDVIWIFSSNCASRAGDSVNGENVAHHMFSVFYRPLGMLFFGIEYFLWGLNAYWFYLVNILLHSINSVLLFNIFSWFVSIRCAFLGALLFLFHGSVGSWIFLMCTNQDLLNWMLFLLVILFYRRYLNSNAYKYYFFSVLLFFMCLFTRETFAVFPGALFLFTFIADFQRCKTYFTLLFNAIKKTYVFFLSLVVYLVIRVFIFGFNSADLGYLSGPNATSLKEYIWNCLEFLKDVSGFTFLNNPDPRSKILVLVPFLLFLVFLFIASTQKVYLLILGLSVFLFSWPSLYITHHARYAYPGISFFILFLLISFEYSRIFSKDFRILCYVFLLMLMTWGIIDGASLISNNEEITYAGELALKDFVEVHLDNFNKSEKVVFLGLPHWLFFPFLAEAIFLYSGKEDFQVQVDYIRDVDFILGDYRRLESYKKIEGGFSIHAIKNGYRLVSHDGRLFFYAPPQIDEKGKENNVYSSYLGAKIINERFDKWRAKDVSFIFNKDHFLCDEDIKFFSWDWQKKRFCLLRS